MRESTDAATDRFIRLSQLPLTPVGSPHTRFASLASWLELWRSRRILGMFIRRDIRARYKDSLFGILWTLIRPLVQLLIFYLVIGKFLGAERGIPNFAIYIFTGLTVWSLFYEIIYAGTGSIINNSGVIKKVYLPRELFPLTTVGVALFNFAIQLGILTIAVSLSSNIFASLRLEIFLPAFLVILLFSTGSTLLLSGINVHFRDTQYLVEVALMVLMWASPIMYSWSMAQSVLGNGWALAIYTANPVTLAVLGFQQSFWAGGVDATVAIPENFQVLLWGAVVISAIYTIIAQGVFSRLQGNFAQVI